MPPALTYPGVYIQEIPSGVRTIVGVATSITAFLGRAANGPDNEPVMINSFADFERRFGGLGKDYPMSYAVRDFYLNGGSQALIVRLFKAPDGSDGFAQIPIAPLALQAAYRGEWGKKLRVTVEQIDASAAADVRSSLGLQPTDPVFNLTATTGPDGITERIRNLSTKDSSRRIDKVLKEESRLLRWKESVDPTSISSVTFDTDQATKKDADLKSKTQALQAARIPAGKPDPTKVKTAQDDLTAKQKTLSDAKNAQTPNQTDIDKAQKDVDQALKVLDYASRGVDVDKAIAAEQAVSAAQDAVNGVEASMKAANSVALVAGSYTDNRDKKMGIFALEKADLFNLLCIPPDQREGDTGQDVYQAALQYCVERRAMLLVDPPASWGKAGDGAAAAAAAGFPGLGLAGQQARNGALYFPRLIELDPNKDGKPEVFVPCGAVAGVMASTDVQRGVWKAPAGLDAAVNGIAGLEVNLTDLENGSLNQIGINCLRFFQINGRVVWGARTLRGADQLADEYKYVPVRRLALFIEESLYRGTQWVVFEPNDEPLWAQIRLNVGAFMHNLFRQGAFQGTTPRDAYFVKCDKETTTQNDVDLGVVNINVGFAPLKPAEFVVIKLQQMAGQIET
jgi:phage tail sheath protein FI